jgi:hypothetical protein
VLAAGRLDRGAWDDGSGYTLSLWEETDAGQAE